MADPNRIVDDPDAAPLARALLASAAGDAPGPGDRAAVARRLGLAATLVATTAGEVGAGAVAASVAWWKIGLAIVALGGAVTTAVVATRSPAPTPTITPAPAPAIAPAPASPAPAVVSAPSSAPPIALAPAPAPSSPPAIAASRAPSRSPELAPSPPVRSPASVTTAAPAPSAPARVAPRGPTPSAAPAAAARPAPDARRLAAEVALLDRARAALRRDEPAIAGAALDDHARGFADGALLAEAELLRIELAIHRGDAASARDRAHAFNVRFPQSPLAKRLRSLVDRLPPAPAVPPTAPQESP